MNRKILFMGVTFIVISFTCNFSYASASKLESLSAKVNELESKKKIAFNNKKNKKAKKIHKKQCRVIKKFEPLARQQNLTSLTYSELNRYARILKSAFNCPKLSETIELQKNNRRWRHEIEQRQRAVSSSIAENAVAQYRDGINRFNENCNDSVAAQTECALAFSPILEEIILLRDSAEEEGLVRSAHFQEARARKVADRFGKHVNYTNRYAGLYGSNSSYLITFNIKPYRTEGNCRHLINALDRFAYEIEGSYENRYNQIKVAVDLYVDARCAFTESSNIIAEEENLNQNITEQCINENSRKINKADNCLAENYHSFIRKPRPWNAYDENYRQLIWNSCQTQTPAQASPKCETIAENTDKTYTAGTSYLEANANLSAQGALILEGPHGHRVHPMQFNIQSSKSARLNDSAQKKVHSKSKVLEDLELSAFDNIQDKIDQHIRALIIPDLERFMAFYPLTNPLDQSTLLPRFPLLPLTPKQREQGLQAALESTSPNALAEEYLLEAYTWNSISAIVVNLTPPPEIPKDASEYWKRVYGKKFTMRLDGGF